MDHFNESFGEEILTLELFLIDCKQDGYGIEIINEDQDETTGCYITKDEMGWEIINNKKYIILKLINNINRETIEKNIKSIEDFDDYLILNTDSGKIVIREI